jgi:hypothetical protein
VAKRRFDFKGQTSAPLKFYSRKVAKVLEKGGSNSCIRGQRSGWLLALAVGFKFGFNSCIRG